MALMLVLFILDHNNSISPLAAERFLCEFVGRDCIAQEIVQKDKEVAFS